MHPEKWKSHDIIYRYVPEEYRCKDREKAVVFFWLLGMYEKIAYPLSQIFKGFLYSTPFIILSMTIERFVLVTRPSLSNLIRTRRNRIVYYFITTLSSLSVPFLRVGDFAWAKIVGHTNQRKNEGQQCVTSIAFFHFNNLKRIFILWDKKRRPGSLSQSENPILWVQTHLCCYLN